MDFLRRNNHEEDANYDLDKLDRKDASSYEEKKVNAKKY